MDANRMDATTGTKLIRLREKVRATRFAGGVSDAGKDVVNLASKPGKSWWSRLGRWLYNVNPKYFQRMY